MVIFNDFSEHFMQSSLFSERERLLFIQKYFEFCLTIVTAFFCIQIMIFLHKFLISNQINYISYIEHNIVAIKMYFDACNCILIYMYKCVYK
jgi:hypothetical protein